MQKEKRLSHTNGHGDGVGVAMGSEGEMMVEEIICTTNKRSFQNHTYLN